MNNHQFNRRNFLQLSGMGLLGAALPFHSMFSGNSSLKASEGPLSMLSGNSTSIVSGSSSPTISGNSPSMVTGKWKPAKLSVQLYTVREQFRTDIPGTLKKVRQIGFENVETAFWPDGVSLQQAAKYIRDAGLSVSSCHVEIPVGDKKHVMLETAKAYNCKRMIWHGWPEDKRYSSLEGTMELAGIYNEAAKFAKANGLQFGLHNHWWEYRNKPGGKYVYEILLENLDPDIFFEVDTYWVKVAGQDPAAIVKKLGSRAQLLHIKDGPARWNENLPADNPDPMTAVGQGTQNFPAIVQAADGNTEWMVVEMDKTTTDVFVALKESYTYLVNNKLVRT